MSTSSSEPSPQRHESAAVAAVVVTYERKALLRQCLEALQNQTHPVDEIIVVDNASADGTAAMVRSDFPDVTLRVLDENRGGAGGFHEGMKEAVSRDVEWIWVMDDDVKPRPDALAQLFAQGLHNQDSTVALASQKVGTDGQRQATHAGDYHPVWMRKTPVDRTGPEIEEIQFSSFVGLMVKTEAVDHIGLPKAEYFIWGDDTEYSLRLGRVGRLFLVRSSRVIHYDSFATARKKAPILSQAWLDRPLDQYWRNYYSLRNRLLIVNAYAGSLIERWIGYSVGVVRLLRSAAAVLAFDDCKSLRLKVLLKGFKHGVEGRAGKYYDPDAFGPSD